MSKMNPTTLSTSVGINTYEDYTVRLTPKEGPSSSDVRGGRRKSFDEETTNTTESSMNSGSFFPRRKSMDTDGTSLNSMSLPPLSQSSLPEIKHEGFNTRRKNERRRSSTNRRTNKGFMNDQSIMMYNSFPARSRTRNNKATVITIVDPYLEIHDTDSDPETNDTTIEGSMSLSMLMRRGSSVASRNHTLSTPGSSSRYSGGPPRTAAVAAIAAAQRSLDGGGGWGTGDEISYSSRSTFAHSMGGATLQTAATGERLNDPRMVLSTTQIPSIQQVKKEKKKSSKKSKSKSKSKKKKKRKAKTEEPNTIPSSDIFIPSTPVTSSSMPQLMNNDNNSEQITGSIEGDISPTISHKKRQATKLRLMEAYLRNLIQEEFKEIEKIKVEQEPLMTQRQKRSPSCGGITLLGDSGGGAAAPSSPSEENGEKEHQLEQTESSRGRRLGMIRDEAPVSSSVGADDDDTLGTESKKTMDDDDELALKQWNDSITVPEEQALDVSISKSDNSFRERSKKWRSIVEPSLATVVVEKVPIDQTEFDNFADFDEFSGPNFSAAKPKSKHRKKAGKKKSAQKKLMKVVNTLSTAVDLSSPPLDSAAIQFSGNESSSLQQNIKRERHSKSFDTLENPFVERNRNSDSNSNGNKLRSGRNSSFEAEFPNLARQGGQSRKSATTPSWKNSVGSAWELTMSTNDDSSFHSKPKGKRHDVFQEVAEKAESKSISPGTQRSHSDAFQNSTSSSTWNFTLSSNDEADQTSMKSAGTKPSQKSEIGETGKAVESPSEVEETNMRRTASLPEVPGTAPRTSSRTVRSLSPGSLSASVPFYDEPTVDTSRGSAAASSGYYSNQAENSVRSTSASKRNSRSSRGRSVTTRSYSSRNTGSVASISTKESRRQPSSRDAGSSVSMSSRVTTGKRSEHSKYGYSGYRNPTKTDALPLKSSLKHSRRQQSVHDNSKHQTKSCLKNGADGHRSKSMPALETSPTVDQDQEAQATSRRAARSISKFDRQPPPKTNQEGHPPDTRKFPEHFLKGFSSRSQSRASGKLSGHQQQLGRSPSKLRAFWNR